MSFEKFTLSDETNVAPLLSDKLRNSTKRLSSELIKLNTNAMEISNDKTGRMHKLT